MGIIGIDPAKSDPQQGWGLNYIGAYYLRTLGEPSIIYLKYNYNKVSFKIVIKFLIFEFINMSDPTTSLGKSE